MLNQLFDIKKEINIVNTKIIEKEAEKSIIQKQLDMLNNELDQLKNKAQSIFNSNFS